MCCRRYVSEIRNAGSSSQYTDILLTSKILFSTSLDPEESADTFEIDSRDSELSPPTFLLLPASHLSLAVRTKILSTVNPNANACSYAGNFSVLFRFELFIQCEKSRPCSGTSQRICMSCMLTSRLRMTFSLTLTFQVRCGANKSSGTASVFELFSSESSKKLSPSSEMASSTKPSEFKESVASTVFRHFPFFSCFSASRNATLIRRFGGPSPGILPAKKFRSYLAKADRFALVLNVQQGSSAVPAPYFLCAVAGNKGTHTKWSPCNSKRVGSFSKLFSGTAIVIFLAQHDKTPNPDNPAAPRTWLPIKSPSNCTFSSLIFPRCTAILMFSLDMLRTYSPMTSSVTANEIVEGEDVSCSCDFEFEFFIPR